MTARKSDTEQPAQAFIHRKKLYQFGNIGYLSDFQTGQTLLDVYLSRGFTPLLHKKDGKKGDALSALDTRHFREES
jgi:hypothetical protein